MTLLLGKDRETEKTIEIFTRELTELGLNLEFTTYLNPGKNIYSCELCDKNNPDIIHTNGKGTCKEAATASALGEMAERLLNQSFFDSYYMNKSTDDCKFNRYHDEIWVKYHPDSINEDGDLNLYSMELGDDSGTNIKKLDRSIKHLIENGLFNYNLIKEINFNTMRPLTDYVTSNIQKGICAVPLTNEFNTDEKVYFPLRYLESCFCTNGMCAGNTPSEAKVQGLSEIYERFVRRFLYGSIPEHFNKKLSKINNRALPKIPDEYLQKYPEIVETIGEFHNHNCRVDCYDASLGGIFPVVLICVRKNNRNQHKISIGAHPNMRIALQRTLTELMQGVEWDTIDYSSFDVSKYTYDFDFTDHSPSYSDEDIQYYTEDSDSDFYDDEWGMDDDNDNSHDSFVSDPKKYAQMNSMNFVKNFVDDSGDIHPSFFTHKSVFKFTDWSVETGSTEEEYAHLLNIAAGLKKTVWCYDASYRDLHAYRLIIPNFSEIYCFNGIENDDELIDPSHSRKFEELDFKNNGLSSLSDFDLGAPLCKELHIVENQSQYKDVNIYIIQSLLNQYMVKHKLHQQCMFLENDLPDIFSSYVNTSSTRVNKKKIELKVHEHMCNLAEVMLNNTHQIVDNHLNNVIFITHIKAYLTQEKNYSPDDADRFLSVLFNPETIKYADKLMDNDTVDELAELIAFDIKKNLGHMSLVKTFKNMIKIQTNLH